MPELPILQVLLPGIAGLLVAGLSIWTGYSAGCGPKWDLFVLLLGCAESQTDEPAWEPGTGRTV